MDGAYKLPKNELFFLEPEDSDTILVYKICANLTNKGRESTENSQCRGLYHFVNLDLQAEPYSPNLGLQAGDDNLLNKPFNLEKEVAFALQDHTLYAHFGAETDERERSPTYHQYVRAILNSLPRLNTFLSVHINKIIKQRKACKTNSGKPSEYSRSWSYIEKALREDTEIVKELELAKRVLRDCQGQGHCFVVNSEKYNQKTFFAQKSEGLSNTYDPTAICAFRETRDALLRNGGIDEGRN